MEFDTPLERVFDYAERIKSKNDTITKFKNKGYRHSTWAEDEVARADELGIIPYSIINKLQKKRCNSWTSWKIF